MSLLTALGIVWVAWLAGWALAARWAGRTEARPERSREIRYYAVQCAGLICYALSPPAQSAAFHLPALWRTGAALGWLMVVAAACGLVFAGWARFHLGRLWSASVTKKSEHRIIDTGPYALVRHPIYTGMLLALAATAVIMGTAAGIAGFLIFIVGFVMKARLEESFLSAEMGEAAYGAYARRTPMLVPFLPARHREGTRS